MRPELRARLAALGASDDDLDRAEREGWLPLLAMDRTIMPGEPRYALGEIVATTGIEERLLRRLWRALGFPDVPADLEVFTDRDLRAAQRVMKRARLDGIEPDELVRQVQAVSAAMARVASVEADAIGDVMQRLLQEGRPPDEVAELFVDTLRFDDLAELIDYEHRLQLRAAIWRRLTLDVLPETSVGVGFADLAGYTKATEHLGPDEITALIARWEERAFDTVARCGAHVVKTVGDEVMFTGLPDGVVDAAFALCDIGTADPSLLPVRAGVAAGPVIRRHGDVYGPVVNLASRLTEIAPPGAVIGSAALQSELAGCAVRFTSLGTRRLRGIGLVEVFGLERSG